MTKKRMNHRFCCDVLKVDVILNYQLNGAKTNMSDRNIWNIQPNGRKMGQDLYGIDYT